MRLFPEASNFKTSALSLIVLVGLGACATSGEPREYLAGSAIEAVASGNTAVFERGYNYYAPDGRKIHQRESGEIVLRRWWVSDSNQWCETLVRDGSELCGVRWEKAGDKDYYAVGRGFRIPFQIEDGNPQGL